MTGAMKKSAEIAEESMIIMILEREIQIGWRNLD
jgi:hypothetical protein